jgi:O-antigen ligase
LLSFAAIGVFLGWFLFRKRMVMPIEGTIALLMWILAGVFLMPFKGMNDYSTGKIQVMLSGVAMVFLADQLFVNPTNAKRLITLVELSLWVLFGLTIVEFLNNPTAARAVAFGWNANRLSLFLCLGAVYSVARQGWATSGGRANWRNNLIALLGVAGVGIMAWGVFITGSRGGAISLVAACGIAMLANFTNLRIARWPMFLTLGALAIASMFILAEGNKYSVFARFEAISTKGDLGGRDYLVKKAYDAFTKDPVFGVGIGRLPEEATGNRLDPGHGAHNMYLSVLAEQGILGMTIFIGALALIVIRAVRVAPQRYRPLLYGTVTILLVGGAVGHLEGNRFFFLVIILAIGVTRLGEFERQERLAEMPPPSDPELLPAPA